MNILFQGDSVTDCGRSRDVKGYESSALGGGYPALIQARLFSDRPLDGLQFANRGISGNRIVDLYARWRVDCLNLQPDIVSILIGVNDSWHEMWGNGVDLKRYARIYDELADWTLSALPAARLLLLEPFTAPGSEHETSFGTEVRERGKIVKALAERIGSQRATFIPLQTLLDECCAAAPWQHWTADGVHPSPAFHQKIADAWIAAAKL